MDAFEQLEQQARTKRDAIIKAARADFWEAKRRIHRLRDRILADGKRKLPPP